MNANEDFNMLFNINELQDSLIKCHDSATGPDEIRYQILKHLPKQSLLTLLDIFNYTWVFGNFPDSWREATVIPIPKPGKDANYPTKDNFFQWTAETTNIGNRLSQ